MKERLYLYDNDLADGQQTPGVDFSVEDKIAIARMLDEFGLDYVGRRLSGANPTDTAFFTEKAFGMRASAFGSMTKRAAFRLERSGSGAASAIASDVVCQAAKKFA